MVVYYDARSADMWSLGMILFQCMTNESLFFPEDVWQQKGGYLALKNNKLRKYLFENNLLRLFKKKSLSLLEGLLDIDEKTRFKASEVLKCGWFNVYYKRYANKIKKKLISDTIKLQKQTEELSAFPYY